jgi:hypothetical protein
VCASFTDFIAALYRLQCLERWRGRFLERRRVFLDGVVDFRFASGQRHKAVHFRGVTFEKRDLKALDQGLWHRAHGRGCAAAARSRADAGGDAGKARMAYQDLLALWQDADPDLELPKQARAEFAALRQR